MADFEDELEEELDEDFDDEFEDEWEDYEADEEDFFTGPQYVPAETSINFEQFAIIAAFAMIFFACYLIYTSVLGEAYDVQFMGDHWSEKMKKGQITEAQPVVEILGIGKYHPESDASDFDFLILNAGTNNGLSEGMIFYLVRPDIDDEFDIDTDEAGYWTEKKALVDMQKLQKVGLKMCIVIKVEEDLAWAEFCEFTTNTSQKILDRIYNVEITYGEYLTSADPETKLPAFPRKSKKLQYFCWEEAYDVSKMPKYNPYKVTVVGKELKLIEKQSITTDYLDPNPKWDILRKVQYTKKDILELIDGDIENITSNKIVIGENKEKKKDAIIIFYEPPYAYLAPSKDQRVYRDIFAALEE